MALHPSYYGLDWLLGFRQYHPSRELSELKGFCGTRFIAQPPVDRNGL